MNTLAAPGLGGIFGSVGFAGAAFVMTLVLVAGIKGQGKIKFGDQYTAAVWGLITGQLYALAGGMWSSAGTVSGGVAQSLQGGFGGAGGFGMGAVAFTFLAIAFGFRIGKGPASVLGILAPPIFTAAGGMFAIVTNLMTGFLTQIVGG